VQKFKSLSFLYGDQGHYLQRWCIWLCKKCCCLQCSFLASDWTFLAIIRAPLHPATTGPASYPSPIRATRHPARQGAQRPARRALPSNRINPGAWLVGRHKNLTITGLGDDCLSSPIDPTATHTPTTATKIVTKKNSRNDLVAVWTERRCGVFDDEGARWWCTSTVARVGGWRDTDPGALASPAALYSG